MNYRDINNKCTKCGNCCRGFSKERGIILFPKDFEIIPNKLKVSLEKFRKSYCNVQHVTTISKKVKIYSLRFNKEGCIFLKGSGLCSAL